MKTPFSFIRFITCVLAAAVLAAPAYAQKSRALVRIIKGPAETSAKKLPAKAELFRARVLDRSKLAYEPGKLDKMMENDRTDADQILTRRQLPDGASLEKTLRKKTYEVMPPAVVPSPETRLRAAILSSEETAARIARNGGGRAFDIMSPEAAIRTYYARMQEFGELKREIDVKMFYYKADGVSLSSRATREVADMTRRVAELRVRVKFLLLYYFPEDLPLYMANKYLTGRLIELQPGLGGLLEKMPVFRRTDRVFDRDEFMLEAPAEDARVPVLPGGLKIAVVNDSEDILFTLSSFARWGNFGAGAKVTTFDNIYTLMAELQNGAAYDVVFSDISMPNGSGMLLVSKMRENNNNTPVIGLSGYKEDAVRGRDLFELGFDGYIVSDRYGYRQAPEALRNYFYYRKLHKWIR